MYKIVNDKLNNLKNDNLVAIIDEGRARKRKEKCRILKIYNRIFTLEMNNIVTSFCYSDIICKTIILEKA